MFQYQIDRGLPDGKLHGISADRYAKIAPFPHPFGNHGMGHVDSQEAPRRRGNYRPDPPRADPNLPAVFTSALLHRHPSQPSLKTSRSGPEIIVVATKNMLVPSICNR